MWREMPYPCLVVGSENIELKEMSRLYLAEIHAKINCFLSPGDL